MKILITGAAGFIGYHLCDSLLGNGCMIVGLDSINPYYDETFKYMRLENLGIAKKDIEEGKLCVSGKNSNFRFIKLDLCSREKLFKLFEDEKFDIVCNLAAQAGVRYSVENPYVYTESNISGFLNILEGCRRSNIPSLLYASSSSVYGLNKDQPFSENDKTEMPVSMYAATKKANELMAHVYSNLYGIKSIGLRFFTVYGPLGRPDMAYFKFAENIMSGRSIDIYNNWKMKRDFTYIDDIVKGMKKIIFSDFWTDPGVKYKIYNIGRGKPESLRDFVGCIEKELGKKAKYNMLPMQPGDVAETYADVSALENDFRYRPSVNIDEGIKIFIEWFVGYKKNGK